MKQGTRQTLGNFKHYQIQGNFLHITGEGGKLRISLLDTGAIRVQAIQNEAAFNDFSYAVSRREAISFPSIIEESDHLICRFSEVELTIQKFPLLLEFYTLTGQLINKDDPFGISWDGTEVTNYKTLQEGERFIGLGEKTGNLDRRGTQLTNWNTDVFGYGPHSDPLYASVPFYMGIANDLPYGIFLDNTAKSVFNFGASNDRFSFFQAERGELDYYFFYYGNVRGILNSYSDLTGRMELPPLWSLGYQQCRYSYFPDTEVLSVAKTFREKEIPADVIYLDIHYMQDYKVFTFHDERFPDPKTMIKELEDLGFKVVVIIDPGVKIEEGYSIYHSGLEKEVFVKYPDGTNYTGSVWPGPCHFPDFTKPATRAWWSSKFKDLSETGISGFWNDMNEPAVWGNSFPDLTEFDYDNQPTNHKTAHNIYGMQMARSTYDGAKQFKPNERPFILTRSAFAGSQRFSAIWTGDNCSGDEHLLLAARMITNLGLSGMPFAGNDIGGFVGDCSIDLYNKWIALGAFMPFFRGHSMVNSKDSEPWTYGETSEAIARNYINLRYQLLPYLYASFYESSSNGMPVCRSLAIDYYQEAAVYSYQNQFLFGPSLLVCPVVPNRDLEKVYLPSGEWYDLFTDQLLEGKQEAIVEVAKDKIPLFVIAGAFLILQSVIQHTEEVAKGPLEIHYYKGTDPFQFEYYEDDGKSYNYEQGDYYKINLQAQPAENQIVLGKREGKLPSKYQSIRLFFHGFSKDPSLKINGNKISLQNTNYQWMEPLPNFNPFLSKKEDLSKTIIDLSYIDFPITEEEIVVEWK